MMLCEHCNSVFDYDQLKCVSKKIGNNFGTLSFEEFFVCPNCGKSDFCEVEECVKCEGLKEEYELFDGICQDCILSYAKDHDFLIRAGNASKDKVELNGFLSWFFTSSEIEEILISEFKKTMDIKKADLSDYIKDDLYWFSEFIRKEEKL